ncbi:RNA helicase [Acidobacteria bacterium Mor1]|nr:RNA helicase [Acidobacteria bacterium Mor1]
MTDQSGVVFGDLALSKPVLRAVDRIGYESPSPIQARSIPPLLEGKDLLGQAQTGTGKTAAFALPLLSNLDLKAPHPQVLVLAPTRELAIQVAEAMQTYACYMPGFRVLPVYGGQSMEIQLRQLRRGVHAVVGTPGRIQDHLRRGTLRLDKLTTVVLDEADEMLRMGFIDEVREILAQTPDEKQVALFSATMPREIRRVASEYLRDPVEIKIQARTATVETLTQLFFQVGGMQNKLDALTRVLEAEEFDAMLVFVRTRVTTVELAQKLEARGFACAPLSGDMSQSSRERTIERLKNGALDIVVATDVAARGIHVDRISHVVNFDVPYDAEAYVHRIGRTARAGREGKAILFISPRERRLLRSIERVTGQRIEPMRMPTQKDVTDRRISQFKRALGAAIDEQDLRVYRAVVDEFIEENDVDVASVAAALAYMAQQSRPLLPYRPAKPAPEPAPEQTHDRTPEPRDAAAGGPKRPQPSGSAGDLAPSGTPYMERYRIDVGREHGVQPGNIVGALANEVGLDAEFIGAIRILDDHSIVELPEGLPKAILHHLKKVWVCRRQLGIRLYREGMSKPVRPRPKAGSRTPAGPPRKPAKKFGKPRKGAGKPTKKVRGKAKGR